MTRLTKLLPGCSPRQHAMDNNKEGPKASRSLVTVAADSQCSLVISDLSESAGGGADQLYLIERDRCRLLDPTYPPSPRNLHRFGRPIQKSPGPQAAHTAENSLARVQKPRIPFPDGAVFLQAGHGDAYKVPPRSLRPARDAWSCLHHYRSYCCHSEWTGELLSSASR